MFIAQRMAEFLADYEVNADGVTYVPIHKNRLKMRGYDQTELIANLSEFSVTGQTEEAFIS